MDCMNEIVTARNTEDGTVGRYKRSFVEHPILGKYLEEVPFDAKPRIPLRDVVEAYEDFKRPVIDTEDEEDSTEADVSEDVQVYDEDDRPEKEDI